jgi:hypothetical protein
VVVEARICIRTASDPPVLSSIWSNSRRLCEKKLDRGFDHKMVAKARHEMRSVRRAHDLVKLRSGN